MALAITNLTSGSEADGADTTGSVTIDNNAMLLVSVAAAAEGGQNVIDITVSNSTLASVTWTQLGFREYGDRRAISVYKGVNTSGSSQSGTISIAATASGGGVLQEMLWIVDKATGIDTTTPNGTVVTNIAAGVTSLSVTVTGTPDAGDYVFGAYAVTGATNDMTINGELSNELVELGGGAQVRRLLSAYDSTPDSNPTPGVAFSSDDAGGIAFIINVGAGGGGGRTTKNTRNFPLGDQVGMGFMIH